MVNTGAGGFGPGAAPLEAVTVLVHHRGGVQAVHLRPGQEVVIGRAPPSGLAIRDPLLSREHARVRFEENEVWVEDLKSKNGTRVDGQPITRHLLTTEERVTMPGVTVWFVPADSVPALPTEEWNVDQEMAAARRIQERMVGPQELVTRGPLSFAGVYRPANICGGDFWNAFEIDEDRTLIVVGDVTGHGLPAAMITASVKGCCETLRSTQGPDVSVTKLLTTLNQVISEVGHSKLMMTLFATLLDLRQRTLTYANAAHPHPYLCRLVNGRHEVRALVAAGLRLGDRPDAEFRSTQLPLVSHDVIAWFTDGLTEGADTWTTMLREKWLRETLREQAHLPLAELRDRLLRDAPVFQGAAALEDDVTLVVAKVVF